MGSRSKFARVSGPSIGWSWQWRVRLVRQGKRSHLVDTDGVEGWFRRFPVTAKKDLTVSLFQAERRAKAKARGTGRRRVRVRRRA